MKVKFNADRPDADVIRKNLRHPSSGSTPFREDGIAEWPDDQFTRRRIRDGDVTIVEDHQTVALSPLQATPSSEAPAAPGNPEPKPPKK